MLTVDCQLLCNPKEGPRVSFPAVGSQRVNLFCKVVVQAASAGALLFAVAAHAQTDRTSVDQAILESVALLVHAQYGDDPYQLIYTPVERRSSTRPAAGRYASL